MKELLKVVCLKDGFYEDDANRKQFCTKGKEYKVDNQYKSSFNIQDDNKSIHDFTLDGNEWFKLIYKGEEQLNNKESDSMNINFKIGDEVRITQDIGGTIAKVGDLATVLEIGKRDYTILLNKDSSDWYADDEHLELVKKVCRFKIGDKVKVIGDPGYVSCARKGDTAEVIDVDKSYSCQIELDTGKYKQWVHTNSLELITNINSQLLNIITKGTTTTVQLKGGKEGGREASAKLFHGDVYSKGFGIVTALSKVLDIDLVAEVIKVVKSYDEPTKEEIEAFADRAVLTHREFKIGDIVEMNTERATYGSCRVKIHDVGKVILIGERVVRVKFAAHENLGVAPGDIKLVKVEESKPKFKLGDMIKGIDKEHYLITNTEMNRAVVTSCSKEGAIKIKILDHKDEDFIKREYDVESEYFELVEPPHKALTKFAVGDRIKLPTTKHGDILTARNYSRHIKEAKDLGQGYLYLVEIDKYNHYVLAATNNRGIGDFFDIKDLELYVETPSYKKPILKEEFKVGDYVRVREDLIPESRHFRNVMFREDMAKYKGKTFKIVAIDLDYLYTFEEIDWSWTYDMLEKVTGDKLLQAQREESDKIVAGYQKQIDELEAKEKSKLKRGDKVRMISEHPVHGFGGVETGDVGTIIIMDAAGNIDVNFPNQKCWSAELSDIEVVIEPKYKVGDEVTKSEAIGIIENGGVIKMCDLKYYLKDGKLMFQSSCQTVVSGGYHWNFGEDDSYVVIKL